MSAIERPGGPIAILAGSGDLPWRLAERLRTAGRDHRILAFRGFCERKIRVRADAVVNLLDVGRIESCLRNWQPVAVTLAGGLTRPTPAALIGAYSALRDREELTAIVSRGDDNLLRGAIDVLERKGFTIVGVRDLAPDLLAETGAYGVHRPSFSHESSIALGLRLLDGISSYDVGQAIVISGERILAIEGPEGTDRMLSRARSLRGGGFFRRRARGGILIKAPKRGQDLRVDLPAIGPKTIVNAARAGLDGIAVASGLTIVLRREDTVAAADRRGLFLVGVEMDESSAAAIEARAADLEVALKLRGVGQADG